SRRPAGGRSRHRHGDPATLRSAQAAEGGSHQENRRGLAAVPHGRVLVSVAEPGKHSLTLLCGFRLQTERRRRNPEHGDSITQIAVALTAVLSLAAPSAQQADTVP